MARPLDDFLGTPFGTPSALTTPLTSFPTARPERAPGIGGEDPRFPGTDVPPGTPPLTAPPPTAPPAPTGGFTASGNPLQDLSWFHRLPPTNEGFLQLLNTLKAAYPGRVSDVGASATGVWDKVVIDGTVYDVIQSAGGPGARWMSPLSEGPPGAAGPGGVAGFDGRIFESPELEGFAQAIRDRINQLGTPAATPELEGLMDLLRQSQTPSALNIPTRDQIVAGGVQAAYDWTRQIHQQLLRRDPTQQELDAWGAGILFGSVTPDALVNQMLRDNPVARSTLELEGTGFDILGQTLRGQLATPQGITDLMAQLGIREEQLREPGADIAGLQEAIELISGQLTRAQQPLELQGLTDLLDMVRGQVTGLEGRDPTALASEQQFADLLQGRIDELAQGPTDITLAAQEAQAFDAMAASRDAALARMDEYAQQRGVAPGSGVMLAQRAEAERGFSEIQAQQQQALILRRHEEEQLRAQERLATAGDLATLNQMREQLELDRQEQQRNLQRQVDLLEEEQRARLDGQEDRARDLALQRSELQRSMQDRIDARERELVETIGSRADIEAAERSRQAGTAGELFGLEQLGQQLSQAQQAQLAGLEQDQIARDQARLDQILQLEGLLPELSRQGLLDAMAALGLGSAPASGSLIQSLLGIGQLGMQSQQQTSQYLSGLGQMLGFGLGQQLRPTEPATV